MAVEPFAVYVIYAFLFVVCIVAVVIDLSHSIERHSKRIFTLEKRVRHIDGLRKVTELEGQP